MADARTKKALREVRDAQARFRREQATARNARREAFAKARNAGLSLRDIADAADLHHSSIAEIIAGK